MVANGAPRVSTFVVELNGEKYLLANPSAAGEAGGRSWQETERPVQEATREEEFSIPLTSFDEGAGFSYAKTANVYDYADGWDATTPGKLSTWPLRATGASKTSTDFRGWLIFHDNALYTMRGRFVNKYTIDDTKDATWAIVETHDLGSGIACCGRPAIFRGNLYVPRVTTSSDTLAVFHELTTTATYVTEVQTIVISGSPNAGTYTISFDGKTTAALDFDASESEVQTALRAVAGMEQVTVSTSGTTPNFTHTVTMTGVGASLGAASPPQMTSTPDGAFTGAGGSIAHATTTAGTADTWTAGPATREARCFRVWLNKLVLANANQVRTVSADPMTAGNWSAAYDVGDSSHIINDLAPYDRYLMVGKTDGLWSFDEGLDTQNELPDLQASVDDDNCIPMEYSNGYLLVPHKVGLVRWRPGSYEFVGPSQDGELEGEIGRGWGRVYGIAPYGKQVFVMVNDTYHSEGAITSMLPGKGNRFPLVPHIHHLTDTGESFEGAAVLASLTQPATPNSPDTLSDDNAVGTVTWTDASNAGANDQAYATATIGTTHYLKALDFDFTVPTDATIKGILVEIERKVAGS